MLKQNTINPFIDQVVLTIDSMFENTNIPQSFKDYLYLICTGMILKYGRDYTKDIYSSINNTKYIYGLVGLQDKLSKEEYEYLLPRLKTNANAYTISSVRTENKQIKIQYKIIITKDRNNKLQLLEYLTHELNHILSSLRNTFTKTNNGIYFRYGLFKTNLSTPNKKESGRIFNEIINTLETEDIINQLIELRKYKIYNHKFLDALKMLDTIKEQYTATGYEPFVNLYRPLYNKKPFRDLIDKSMLEGNIESIEKEINTKLENSSYPEMISELDKLYDSYEFTKSKGLEKAYETSTQYLNFKNNIIYVLIDYKPELAF